MPPLNLRAKSFTRVLFTAIPLLDFDFTGFVFDHCAFVDLDLAGSCLKSVTFKVCLGFSGNKLVNEIRTDAINDLFIYFCFYCFVS